MNHRVYFDYCATTPLHPYVVEKMLPALGSVFGNPSSMHDAGREARQMVEHARCAVADGIKSKPKNIIFTSGATEADNLALFGTIRSCNNERRHIIISSIEHHAILHAAQALEKEGTAVTYLPVDRFGIVDPGDVRKAVRNDTLLVSIMMVNNEMGSIQPIAEIGHIAHTAGALFHTDAVQGICVLDLDVDRLGVDLLSLSAHKIYGPKGVGALYIREGTRITPVLLGGPQEKKMRAGTENVPGIIGMGAAVELICRDKIIQRERLVHLKSLLINGILSKIPGSLINGLEKQVSPHILSVSFPGVDGEMLLLRLNKAGVAASLGSACTSEDIEPSHVLKAMGMPIEQISATLRFSLGMMTEEEEIYYLLEILPELVSSSKNEK